MFVHGWTPKYVFCDSLTCKPSEMLQRIAPFRASFWCSWFGRLLRSRYDSICACACGLHVSTPFCLSPHRLHCFPGATLRSFFACPWSPFLTIKIVSRTLHSTRFHRTLERFYRTLPTNVLSNSTDLYRTPKKVPLNSIEPSSQRFVKRDRIEPFQSTESRLCRVRMARPGPSEKGRFHQLTYNIKLGRASQR